MAEDKTNEYYSMQVACFNCGKGSAYDVEDYEIFIPKGVEADKFFETHPCENCGCYTLNKIINFVNPIRATSYKDRQEKNNKKETEEDNDDVKPLNTDMPRINPFKKKPKLKVAKIIK